VGICGVAFTGSRRNTDGGVAVWTRLCPGSSSGSVAAVSEKAADLAVDITVNGKSMRVPAGSTVAALLLLLGVEKTRVAVEKNKDVVPRKSYDETSLADGDRVEVVTFVGGG
jgi:thiamine biosynthesis protein ThiS